MFIAEKPVKWVDVNTVSIDPALRVWGFRVLGFRVLEFRVYRVLGFRVCFGFRVVFGDVSSRG